MYLAPQFSERPDKAYFNITTYINLENEAAATLFSDGACDFSINRHYKFGDMITGMLDLSVSDIEETYQRILHDMIAASVKGDFSQTTKLKSRCAQLDSNFPCLAVHNHLLHNSVYMLLWRSNDDKEFEIYPVICEIVGGQRAIKKHPYNSGLIFGTKNNIDKRTITAYYQFLCDSLIEDILFIRDIVQKKAEQLYKTHSIQQLDFNPMQRLSYYEKALFFTEPNALPLIEYEFERKIVHNSLEMNADYPWDDLDLINRLLEYPRPLLDVYALKNTLDLFTLDFIKVIQGGKIILKCAHCGRLFIPDDKRTVKYCNKIAPGEQLPCDTIGPKRAFENKISENPIYVAYNRAYKRNHARMKQYKISQYEYKEWTEKARDLRAQCLKGEITLLEFTKWLDQRI